MMTVVSVVLVLFKLFTLGVGRGSHCGHGAGANGGVCGAGGVWIIHVGGWGRQVTIAIGARDNCGVYAACVGEVVYAGGWTGEVIVAIGLVIIVMSLGPG